MSIFRKHAKGKNLFFLMPDGSRPEINSPFDFTELMTRWTRSVSEYSSIELPSSDIKSYIEVSTKAYLFGLNDQDKIIAWGDVKLMGFPKTYNTYNGTGVLTDKYLVVYWYYHSLLSPEFVVLDLSQCMGMTSLGTFSAAFNWKEAVLGDSKGVTHFKDVYFELFDRMGRDGHANRRTMILLSSFSKAIGTQSKNWEHDKG